MFKQIIVGAYLITLLSGCAQNSDSKFFTGAEVRDKLNGSVETMVDWACLGEWEKEIVDYNSTISNGHFTNMNPNSYNITKANSESQGIKLMHGEPYDTVRVVTVLSKNEAIITFGKQNPQSYYFNTKSVKNIKKTPAFYDDQWISIESNVCLAVDGLKTHTYQSVGGARTVQNVTLIPRYMKNQYYKPAKKTTDETK